MLDYVTYCKDNRVSVDEAAARGRPRDPRTDRDVIAATRRLLAADGYERVSIEAIAKAAGVSRPTIYRRWPSKAHLVFDAAFAVPTGADLPTPSGDFDADLRAFVRAALHFWGDPVVEAAALGILAERHRDHELHIRTQQLLDERTLTKFRELVRAGIEQGVVDAGVDTDTCYHVLIGTTFYHAQLGATADTDELAERLCALVIQGMRPTTKRKRNQR